METIRPSSRLAARLNLQPLKPRKYRPPLFVCLPRLVSVPDRGGTLSLRCLFSVSVFVISLCLFPCLCPSLQLSWFVLTSLYEVKIQSLSLSLSLFPPPALSHTLSYRLYLTLSHRLSHTLTGFVSHSVSLTGSVSHSVSLTGSVSHPVSLTGSVSHPVSLTGSVSDSHQRQGNRAQSKRSYISLSDTVRSPKLYTHHAPLNALHFQWPLYARETVNSNTIKSRAGCVATEVRVNPREKRAMSTWF